MNAIFPAASVHTLDLNFLGRSGAIAAYLIPHRHGALLIESGPGSTLTALQAGLATHGFSPADITDVLLTHIHLDHAGASGWLARQGARIYVHPVGAPHLLNPEKLLASAARIYGDLMERLWGEFLPVPSEQLTVLPPDEEIEIAGMRFQVLDTPGHAGHHYAYLYAGICFSGDVGGIRLPGLRHLRLPMPPPEFHLEKWRTSVARLQSAYLAGGYTQIAPTHFGIFPDAGWHLAALDKALGDSGSWMESVIPAHPPIEELIDLYLRWVQLRSQADGLTSDQIQDYEAANPSWMSPYGMQRYWDKERNYPQPLE